MDFITPTRPLVCCGGGYQDTGAQLAVVPDDGVPEIGQVRAKNAALYIADGRATEWLSPEAIAAKAEADAVALAKAEADAAALAKAEADAAAKAKTGGK